MEYGIVDSLNSILHNISKVDEGLASLLDTGSTINGLKKEIVLVNRKMKQVDDLITLQRSYTRPNKIYVTKLCDEKLALIKKKETIESIISKYDILLERLMQFISTNKYDEKLFESHSEVELKLLAETATFFITTSISKSRLIIIEYFEKTTDNVIVDFINGNMKLRGFKRLYLQDNKINSYYFNNLREIIEYRCRKKEFYLLLEIIREIYGNKERLLTPLKVLEAIIKYYNKRKAE